MNSNISIQFQNCFREFTLDVIERPEMVKSNFLSMIESKISSQEYRELIKFFINDLLSYKIEDDPGDVIHTFTNQKTISIEIEQEKFQLLSGILSNFSVNHGGFVVKKLCKMLQHHSHEKFNWFFMLLVMRCLDQKNAKIIEEWKSEFGIFFIKTFYNKFIFH